MDTLQILKTPYVNFNRPENLEEYVKIIEEGHYIYGEPYITDENRSPICPDDVFAVAFDENGNKLETKIPYYMTPFGDMYQLKKNHEKKFERINTGGRYELKLSNDTRIKVFSYHLQLYSYYPHLNWSRFCNDTKLRAGIDHILQKHKRCHFKFLEAVPNSENNRRKDVSSNGKNAAIQSGITRGKPFHIWINGIKIERTFETLPIGLKYLNEECRIEISKNTLRTYIISNKEYYCGRYKLRFDYTEEYKETLKDLLGEIWYKPEQWKQRDEIEKNFKSISKKPPKSISNKGRIMDRMGKRVCGYKTRDDNGNLLNYSRFNGVFVHKLVWLAFSKEKIGDLEILHTKQDPSNIFENGICVRYSNAFNTLRCGTTQENVDDRGNDKKFEMERNNMNEFIVKDSNGIEIMRSHHIPDCVKVLNEKYPDNKFQRSNIHVCLNPNKCNITSKGFTFAYVIPRHISSL